MGGCRQRRASLGCLDRAGEPADAARSGAAIRREAACPPGFAELLELGNLAPEDARTLATRLVRERGGESHDSATCAIATESLGHPLFIAELARQLVERGSPEIVAPKLDDALRARYQAQDLSSQSALELLAVAKAPVPLALLCDAMGRARARPSWAELTSILAVLRRENLVRFDGLGGDDKVDFFHHRVAHAVLSQLDESHRRVCSEALARAFERAESTDFESLAVYWQGAGQPVLAASYALEAADRAMHGLAFERASQLYRLHRDLLGGMVKAHAHEGLAQALAHLGRCKDAANAYLDAAAALPPGVLQIERFRLAADQLFRGGTSTTRSR